jgi:hypothetical protein
VRERATSRLEPPLRAMFAVEREVMPANWPQPPPDWRTPRPSHRAMPMIHDPAVAQAAQQREVVFMTDTQFIGARRFGLYGAALFIAWTVFGLLSSAHFFLGYDEKEGLASFLSLADNVIVFYWGWALLTPVVLVAAGRISRTGMHRWQSWALLAATGIAVMLLHGLVHTTVVQVTGIDRSHVGGYSLIHYVQRHVGGDLATFAVLVGGYLLYDANRRARARDLEASKLSARLARADLELLQWNMHPHFLFNALNTVSTLVLKEENEAANRAITLISRYLRTGLAQRADTMVSVGEDVGRVMRYVEIEALRFGDALKLEVEAEGGAMDSLIPGSILQPIVENAIAHGSARDPGAAPIRIRVANRDGRLHLSVVNPGRGGAEIEDAAADSARFGLVYVRERLKQFYGDNARFDLTSDGNQTVASLDLPLGPPASLT